MMTIQRPLFSTDLTVAQVLARCPHTAAVFLQHRMACVGCPMASFETLDSSTRVYGLVPEDFLKELELAAASSN
jgi:hybrid cluster-associated redox disulfide protein